MTADVGAPATAVPPGIRGLTGPSAYAPARVPGSVRRTTNVDIHAEDETLVLEGRARDLVTRADGTGVVIGSALYRLVVDANRRVIQAVSHPAGAERLVGRSVAAGFRTGIWRLLREEYDACSPLHLILDDVPGVLVISGFTVRRIGSTPPPESTPAGSGSASPPPVTRRIDVCAGWSAGSDAVRQLEILGHSPPTQWNPVAPDLAAVDPLAWHTMPALRKGAMRRARRLDVMPFAAGGAGDDGPMPGRVTPPTAYTGDVMFRDTFIGKDGEPRILHEYAAEALLDGEIVEAIRPTARVLPHPECPLAMASAARLEGHRAEDLRDYVSTNLYGPDSCTHLNDLLRGLTDLPALAAATQGEA